MPILALLATAFFWGLLWYPMRWLEGHGVPGLWGTGILFASALAVGSPLLWRYRGQLTARPALLLGLMLANGWCNTAFILAVLDGQVVRVLLLFYLSPIWAVLLARLLLGERMPSQAWLTLVLAMGSSYGNPRWACPGRKVMPIGWRSRPVWASPFPMCWSAWVRIWRSDSKS